MNINRKLNLKKQLIKAIKTITTQSTNKSYGSLESTKGLVIEAIGINQPIGSRFSIKTSIGEVIADLVGFSHNKASLLPVNSTKGLRPGAEVEMISEESDLAVGPQLLGRVINAIGLPLDGCGPIICEDRLPLVRQGISPMERGIIDEPLDVGVRAINGLLTIGKGQRIGLFAGTGVGKSVLLSMIAKNTTADIVVIGLIGERGREVKEFVEKTLNQETRKKSIIVACPADEPPLLRLQGAQAATTIAEYFRDQGLNVLLIMDSLTRFAQAQREVALSLGEPPASKGYPPSVFAMLPALVERAGKGNNGGSITAIYTVLTEGDDSNDPVADSARGVLDGHIFLSRSIASMGIYPAIDVSASISRVMTEITVQRHQQAALKFKRIYADYNSNRDLINVGAYQMGKDANIDMAINLYPTIEQYIKQSPTESVNIEDSINRLYEI